MESWAAPYTTSSPFQLRSAVICRKKKFKQTHPFLFYPLASVNHSAFFCTSLSRLSHSFSLCKTKVLSTPPPGMSNRLIFLVHTTGFYAIKCHELHTEFMLTQYRLFSHYSFTYLKSTFDHKFFFDQLQQSLQRRVKLFTLSKILPLWRNSVSSLLFNSITTSEHSCWFIIY